jgi:holo-[acyl-carrier protein] synthase
MEAPDIYLGNDLIEVSRILSSINKIGKRFLDRVYTKVEQDYCKTKANPQIHYAGRFAAKEAVMKAIKSSGFQKPISFKSIEIRSGDNGEPIVNLDLPIHGKCRVSISHTESHAIASAIYIL